MINVLESSKNELKLEVENVTLAEILRVYLNRDPAVKFAAWRKKHPIEKPILLIKTKGKTAKKVVNDAVNSAVKDLDKVEADFDKLK